MKNIDFQVVLVDFINRLGLSLTARLDYLKENDDLVVYPLPGGKVDTEYMDGTQEISLPFEIAIKSTDQELASSHLWTINSKLSAFDLQLPSQNQSYVYLGLDLSKPSLVDKDEQGYFIYILDVTVRVEVEKE